MPPKFYNLADQKLFEKYQYLPQEKYRLGFTPPTDATQDEDEVITDQGIVNTDAFASSGGGMDFSPTGNMFGEGSPVNPFYGNTYLDVVKKEGPDSQQAVEALNNAGGTYPGGYHTNEGGLEYTNSFPDNSVQVENLDDNYSVNSYQNKGNTFQGEKFNASIEDEKDMIAALASEGINSDMPLPNERGFYKFNDNRFSTLRSTPDVFDVNKRGDPALNAASKMAQGDDPYGKVDEEEETQNIFSKLFNKAGQIKANIPNALKGIVSLLSPLPFVPTILSTIGGNDGPSYGIAGLTDEEKGVYDSFAATGNLFKTDSGFKTFDGKNFSSIVKDPQAYVDKYYDSQKNQINPITGKPFGTMSAYKDYLDKGGKKKDKKTVTTLLKQYDIIDKIKKDLEKKAKDTPKPKDTNPDGDGKNKDKDTPEFSAPTKPGQSPKGSMTGNNNGGQGGSTGGTGGSTGAGDSTGQSTGDSGGYNDGNYCFDPSTPIQMADGSTKKIKNIQLGDNTKGGEVTGVFQFKASDEIHDYKGVTVAGSHYVKEDGRFIMVKDSPLAVKIDKIPVVYSLDTTARRIFIKDIEFADYNGDGVAKNFLSNAGVDLSGFDKEVLRQVENRLI